MATYTRHCIPLKKSILVFFPECPNTRNGYSLEKDSFVVQVMIRQHYKDIVKELTTFFLSQFEITVGAIQFVTSALIFRNDQKAVESVLYAHIITPLPEEVCIEGVGYVLHGKRRPWDYGKTLNLTWGEKVIRACPDKWAFVFEVVP